MNLRLLLAFIAAILASTALAQTPFREYQNEIAPGQRATLLQSLERGAAFTSADRPYQLLPVARASRLPPGETTAHAAGRLGLATTDLLERRGDLLFYRGLASTATGAAVMTTDNTAAYPVVLNTATRQLGFLPGTIRVRLARAGDPEAVAAAHGAKVYRSFPQLGVAYLQAGSGQDIVSLASTLAADARVTSAEPEVVEHLRVPR